MKTNLSEVVHLQSQVAIGQDGSHFYVNRDRSKFHSKVFEFDENFSKWFLDKQRVLYSLSNLNFGPVTESTQIVKLVELFGEFSEGKLKVSNLSDIPFLLDAHFQNRHRLSLTENHGFFIPDRSNILRFVILRWVEFKKGFQVRAKDVDSEYAFSRGGILYTRSAFKFPESFQKS